MAKKFDVVAVGHVTIDEIICPSFQSKEVPGGSALYFAVASADLGMKTAIISQIGEDYAENILNFLSKRRVNCSGLKIAKEATTRLTINYLHDFSRTIEIKKGASYRLASNDVSQEFFNTKLMYLNTAPLDLLLEVSKRACKSKIFTAFDPQDAYKQFLLLKPLLKNINCIHLNEIQIRNITGISEVMLAASEILKQGPGVVLVTKGSKGAEVFTRNKFIKVPAVPAKLKDPTGAGDIFFGVFLAEYLRTKDLKKASLVGSAAAALSVENIGPYSHITFKKIQERLENVLSTV